MKVVLDTNVLVSGIFFGGIPLKIVQSWLYHHRFDVFVTASILEEYFNLIEVLDTQFPFRIVSPRTFLELL